jgi:hypothetical protein
VEQRVGVVVDARLALQPGAGAHDHAARQPRGSADDILRLGDEDVPAPASQAAFAAAEPGEAGADDDDVEVGAPMGAHGSATRSP